MADLVQHKSVVVYVFRAVSLSLLLGAVVTVVLMVVSGFMFSNSGTGIYNLGVGPFVLFQTTKEVLESGGTTAQLTPGSGLFILFGAVPLAAGALTYFLKRKSCGASR